MSYGPVYLRLCTGDLKIVSRKWWDQFLISQLKTQEQKKGIMQNGSMSALPVQMHVSR